MWGEESYCRRQFAFVDRFLPLFEIRFHALQMHGQLTITDVKGMQILQVQIAATHKGHVHTVGRVESRTGVLTVWRRRRIHVIHRLARE